MKTLLESRFAFLFISLMLAATPLLFAQNRSMGPTELELQKLLIDAAFKNGEIAFMAVNLDNGKVIVDHRSGKAMIPASIQKLITTGVALQTLGRDYRFETSFTHTGIVSEDGTLNGNLIIMPHGDPTFGSHYLGLSDKSVLAFIKKELTEKGVKKINGKVILDLTYYNQHNIARGMLWEDMGNYFGASPTSLMWQTNMVKLNLRSGQAGSPVVLANKLTKAFPYEFDLELTASSENRDNAWFFGSPGSNKIYAKGSIPAKRENFSVKISNPDPAYSFAQELIETMGWENTEIRFDKEKVMYESTPLFSMKSESLDKIIQKTNTFSVNLFADALCTELDEQALNKSIEGGIKSIEKYLADQKVSTAGARLMDGSGISPMNRITAETMTSFLGLMYRSDNFNTYLNTLPVAGETGTIKNYFKGTKAAGNLRAKSGTMAGTRNYAGYVTNKYQENIAFCLMMNDFDENRKTIIMNRVQAMLNALIED
jgi:D-alanyl-D-alanine carboxypeptidase/D-alanyl-D-alanine-endopeptidase (penicillin-binding protein 4)